MQSKPQAPTSVIARALAAVEPMYNWGTWYWERLDERGEGYGRYFELEFFGLKLVIAVGRTPPVQ